MHLVAKTWEEHVHKELDPGQSSFPPKKKFLQMIAFFLNITFLSITLRLS